MQLQSLNSSRKKALFIFAITVIYLFIVAGLDFLQGPDWWDETDFWKSSLTFSDNLWPSLEELRTYHSLNTPLPFILWGGLEYLFGGGIFVGRLLNLFLSLGIVVLIGWPSKQKEGRALLCLIGLFLCPYFLWLSGRLYTEMIACMLVLLGFVAYLKDRHGLSCLAFILAISTRQYMLAFPLAVATYEFVRMTKAHRQNRGVEPAQRWRWLAPLLASLSILVWIAIFQGLAPSSAIPGKAPDVQQTLFGLNPRGMIYFLSFIGVYIVIPEFILFRPQTPLKTLRENQTKWLLIAIGLLIFCLVVFPPVDWGSGNVMKISRLLPGAWLQIAFFYALALLTCLRFSKPDLYFWLVFFNSLIMIKAWPWDRYVLPLVVVFWYLKSINYPVVQPKMKTEGSTFPS